MTVKDIELRFVERLVPMPHDPSIGRNVRVLQSRKLVERIDPVGYGYRATYDEWTEWSDVPFVAHPRDPSTGGDA